MLHRNVVNAVARGSRCASSRSRRDTTFACSNVRPAKRSCAWSSRVRALRCIDYLAPLAKHNATRRSMIAGRRWSDAEPLKSPSANPEVITAGRFHQARQNTASRQFSAACAFRMLGTSGIRSAVLRACFRFAASIATCRKINVSRR
jgi:hypothetical protein